MAFHESNRQSFAKKGFSPTDHLCGFHLRINWKLLGVKKYSAFQITAVPVPWKGAGSSLPTVQPSKGKPQGLDADLEQGKSGAFGWYCLYRSEAVCVVCLCVAKDYLLAALML